MGCSPPAFDRSGIDERVFSSQRSVDGHKLASRNIAQYAILGVIVVVRPDGGGQHQRTTNVQLFGATLSDGHFVTIPLTLSSVVERGIWTQRAVFVPR